MLGFFDAFVELGSTLPTAMLLTDLGLSSLKVFCWQQTLHIFNKIAAPPPAYLFHMILLDNHHNCHQSCHDHDELYDDTSHIVT